jgi:malate dehydrogenase (oxaloacetate-decarboxylating)(NADP+)
VGLAVYATEAKRVPDDLFIEAAKATADQVGDEERKQGMLYPPQKDILKIEVQTAIRVAEKIFELGLARVKRPNDIAAWIKGLLYRPEYRTYQSFQRDEHVSPALRSDAINKSK